MNNKYELSEIDNRDSNTTELVMDNGDRLTISYQDAKDIITSFIENQVGGEDNVVQTMCKEVLLDIQDIISENGIDIS